MMLSKSFRDFFSSSFVKERIFERIQPNHFKVFYEMAMFGDKSKLPVNFDKDDIEFLKQFPHEFWSQATHKRYQMLFDAVEKLHQTRVDKGMNELKETLAKAMKTQNWSLLKGLMPDDEIERLSRHLKPELIRKMNDKQIETEADKEAHYHIEKSTEHIEDPGEVEFKFKAGSNRSNKMVTYVAKPFLNRLYHKLERTRGIEHLPGSGLEGEKGEYGYDMRSPVRSPDPDNFTHTTQGMSFPNSTTISNRMQDFYNLNMHRMFGNLPEDVSWRPTKYKDTFTIETLKKELKKEIKQKLMDEEKTVDKKTLDAMIEKRAVELARSGKVKGPPIPGIYPDGVPVEVSGTGDSAKIVAPTLYLPFKSAKTKMKGENGQVEEKEHWVPVVNPAHYFRELGSEKEDYEQEMDAEGNTRVKYGPDGQPMYTVPKDKIRGHNGKYVHVGSDEYKTSHHAPGAMSFNKNTGGSKHLTRGDAGYDEAYQKVFGDQAQVSLNGSPSHNSGFYEDIIAGILMCKNKDACGGNMGEAQKTFVAQNIEDIHNIVFLELSHKLRDEKYYKSSGRKAFAKDVTAQILQRVFGRRLRGSMRGISMDATKDGDKGTQGGMADTLSDRNMEISDKRGKGGRKLGVNTGINDGSNYNLHNFRQHLLELAARSRVADTASERAKQASHDVNDDNYQKVIELLKSGIEEKGDVLDQLVGLLAALYKNTGDEDASQTANTYVKSWIEDGANTSQQLLAKFQQHPLVIQAMNSSNPGKDQTGQAKAVERDAPITPEEQRALDKFHLDFAMMRERGEDISDPKVKEIMLAKPGEKYSHYVKGTIAPMFGGGDDRILSRIQNEINRLLGVADVVPTTSQAARDIGHPVPQPPQAPLPNMAGKSQLDRLRDLRAKRMGGSSSPVADKADLGVSGVGTEPHGGPADVSAVAGESKPEPVVPPKVPTYDSPEHFRDFRDKKDYVGLSHHTEFMKHANLDVLRKMVHLLKQSRDEGKIKPHEYESAMSNVEKRIREKEGQ